MKLLVQADDYGISPAVSRGICHGVTCGIIRNTGMFTNMPWSRECSSWLVPLREHIDIGIDLNITTGSPLCDPCDIPSLVRPDGTFFTSGESRALDRERGGEHVDFADARREFKAQIERYRDLMGSLPAYVHSHAYTTPGIVAVQRELAGEYEVPFASDIWWERAGFDVRGYRIPWYKKPATLENQAASSLTEYLLGHGDELLEREFVVLAGHMGYVDRELMDLSSYTLLRANDLAGATDPRVLEWAEDGDIELVRYRDLA